MKNNGHILCGARCDRGGVQHTGIVGQGGERALTGEDLCILHRPEGVGAWCSSSSEEEEGSV